MGNIIILPETTKNPVSLMGARSGVCYGSDITNPEKNYKRGLDCVKSGHFRVMEYVNVEMIIDGYSARTIREWYTHVIGATKLQSSTRYIDYANKRFDYITPTSIKNNESANIKWKALMNHIQQECASLENDYGISKEDVANALPLGMTTKIVDKRNLRSLMNMSRVRMCSRAYVEYRELFNDICNTLKNYSDEWVWIVENLFYPKCEEFGYCTESRSCGRKPKK